MVKKYSSGAVSDKMEVCLVEKKLILFHRSSSFEMEKQRLFLNLLKWGGTCVFYPFAEISRRPISLILWRNPS